MKTTQYQYSRSQNPLYQDYHRSLSQKYKYINQTDSPHTLPIPSFSRLQKQNNIHSTNLLHKSQLPYQYQYEQQQQQKHIKSTTSTNQLTHPKTSTDNLHAHRLQSIILQLQKTLDQQQYQIETLTEQSNHFIKLCEEQKQILIQLNIQGMKSQYQQQINQLICQRQKIQQIIIQLQEDYKQVYAKEESQLQLLRNKNIQLDRKKCMLSLLAGKDRQLMDEQINYRESQERLDQLRNIQRKLTIALRQLQMLRNKQNRIKNEKNENNVNHGNNGNNNGRLKSKEKVEDKYRQKSKQRSKQKIKQMEIIYQSPKKKVIERQQQKQKGNKFSYITKERQ